MAEPPYWQTVLSQDIWDPYTNAGDAVEPAAENGPEPGGSWAADDASVTYLFDLPANKKYDCRRKCLGYQWPDTSSPWALHRVPPIPHPEERHLYCTAIDIQGYNPWGVDQGGGTYKGGYPAAYLTPPSGSTLFPRVSTYTRARATAKFRPLPYPVVDDATMVAGGYQEYYRHTAVFESCDPVLELLLTQSSPFLQWAESDTGGPTAGNTIPSQQAERLQKATFVMVWYSVPLDFIASPYVPSKILSAVGCVNLEDNWLGVFPKGTLRLEAPRFRKRVQAHIRTDPTNPLTNKSYIVDVILPFTWFDPTPGLGGSSVFRGWNLFPFSNTGKFYSLKRAGSSGTPLPYFSFASFDRMFTHVNAP